MCSVPIADWIYPIPRHLFFLSVPTAVMENILTHRLNVGGFGLSPLSARMPACVCVFVCVCVCVCVCVTMRNVACG